jgi:hypothetical protein
MTWKELYQVLKGKVKAKVEDNATTWIDLLLLLFRENSFFSLREGPKVKLFLFKEKSSKKVLDYFFEKAWERSILKSRPD